MPESMEDRAIGRLTMRLLADRIAGRADHCRDDPKALSKFCDSETGGELNTSQLALLTGMVAKRLRQIPEEQTEGTG